MSEKIPFLDMFPDCASLQDTCGGLDKAEVLDVLIERESMTMLLHTWFARMPAPVERTNIEQLLAAQFRLRGVQIQAEYPAPEQKKAEQKEEDKKHKGTYLRREFSYSQFQQSLILPDNVEKEKIAAKVEHGVLTVEIPKKKEVHVTPAARQIEIK